MRTSLACVLACTFIACSETKSPTISPDARDLAPALPGPDAREVAPDVAPVGPDAGEVVPDLPPGALDGPALDAAPVAPDAPCCVPDGAGLAPDAPAGAAEAAVAAPDGASVAGLDAPQTAAGCSAAPVPSPQMPGSRAPDLLARAATVLGSCLPDDGINRALTNFWNVTIDPALVGGRQALQADCLANARCGCAAVAACLGFVTSGIDAGCTTGCVGDIFSMCGTASDGQVVRTSIDCGTQGLVCDPLAICQEAPTVACDPATFVPSCGSDGRSEICRSKGAGNALFKGPICETLGLGCADGVCVGQGATCAGGYPGPEGQTYLQGTGCSGTALLACVGGRTQTFDCTTIAPGFSCQSVSGTYFCGIASECVPGNLPLGTSVTPNTCDGAQVVLCNAGRIDRVDCLALGFEGCEVDRSKGKYGCVPGGAF
jgi:hypothetical protein